MVELSPPSIVSTNSNLFSSLSTILYLLSNSDVTSGNLPYPFIHSGTVEILLLFKINKTLSSRGYFSSDVKRSISLVNYKYQWHIITEPKNTFILPLPIIKPKIMGSIKSQSELNREIEAFIKQKDTRQETYSEKDKTFINQYIGAGGESTKGGKGEGILYEFYTPTYIVELMWELAYHFGFKSGGHVLEPACGTGRFFASAPNEGSLTGFETNPISARIAEILYPQAEIHNLYFENAFMVPPRYVSRIKEGLTWLKGYPFDLVIGNPPYGKYRNFYSSYFTWPKVIQNEIFFMYYGLKMLKKDGLLVYIIPDRFMRNGAAYNQMKKEMGWICKLLDAYHLPPVFSKTSVATDIIVLQRT